MFKLNKHDSHLGVLFFLKCLYMSVMINKIQGYCKGLLNL